MSRRFTNRVPPMLALGTIAVVAAVAHGCSGENRPTEEAFSTPQQCADSGIDMQICEAEYQQALQKHLQTAPKFNAMATCEEQYGQGRCFETNAQGQAANGGGAGDFFVPFMTGYLVSSALANLSNYAAYRNYRYSSDYVNTPIYRTRTGQTVTSTVSGGKAISRPVNVNTRTVSRSGFGGRSSSRGFFGG
ncbi:DUF1190 domain-containing protein [Jiella sp. MQZ9-1]|uniref:DUF1190 domain-containing protein n=1 Tax=Jiella flava TaxID=2816857 RepID=A0A939JXA7_9HYPH|nr:DUF1190 domain-containing protein [Jiella flava]MBO0663171.1 DUF1190 domain-containing protein [Jiella flava]MCD2471589.1 DUF1190 domain-containing protein [Jiella flava]